MINYKKKSDTNYTFQLNNLPNFNPIQISHFGNVLHSQSLGSVQQNYI